MPTAPRKSSRKTNRPTTYYEMDIDKILDEPEDRGSSAASSAKRKASKDIPLPRSIARTPSAKPAETVFSAYRYRYNLVCAYDNWKSGKSKTRPSRREPDENDRAAAARYSASQARLNDVGLTNKVERAIIWIWKKSEAWPADSQERLEAEENARWVHSMLAVAHAESAVLTDGPPHEVVDHFPAPAPVAESPEPDPPPQAAEKPAPAGPYLHLMSKDSQLQVVLVVIHRMQHSELEPVRRFFGWSPADLFEATKAITEGGVLPAIADYVFKFQCIHDMPNMLPSQTQQDPFQVSYGEVRAINTADFYPMATEIASDDMAPLRALTDIDVSQMPAYAVEFKGIRAEGAPPGGFASGGLSKVIQLAKLGHRARSEARPASQAPAPVEVERDPAEGIPPQWRNDALGEIFEAALSSVPPDAGDSPAKCVIGAVREVIEMHHREEDRRLNLSLQQAIHMTALRVVEDIRTSTRVVAPTQPEILTVAVDMWCARTDAPWPGCMNEETLAAPWKTYAEWHTRNGNDQAVEQTLLSVLHSKYNPRHLKQMCTLYPGLSRRPAPVESDPHTAEDADPPVMEDTHQQGEEDLLASVIKRATRSHVPTDEYPLDVYVVRAVTDAIRRHAAATDKETSPRGKHHRAALQALECACASVPPVVPSPSEITAIAADMWAMRTEKPWIDCIGPGTVLHPSATYTKGYAHGDDERQVEQMLLEALDERLDPSRLTELRDAFQAMSERLAPSPAPPAPKGVPPPPAPSSPQREESHHVTPPTVFNDRRQSHDEDDAIFPMYPRTPSDQEFQGYPATPADGPSGLLD